MPQENVLFLLLEAHTTCLLVLEFQERSCALLSCQSLTSKTHFLQGIRFDGVPCGEHCVNHRITSNKLAFPYPLMMHPENILRSCGPAFAFVRCAVVQLKSAGTAGPCRRGRGRRRGRQVSATALGL